MKRNAGIAWLLLSAVPYTLVTSGCNRQTSIANPEVAFGAYDTEPDWNDPAKLVKLGYRESRASEYSMCIASGAMRTQRLRARQTGRI